MKKCTKCKIKKELSEFGKMSSTRDGLRSDCKSCRKVESKIRYEAKREELILYQRDYQKKNRDRLLPKKREYYWKDPEKYKNIERKNRERSRIIENKRNRENPAKACAKTNKRKAIKLQATPFWLTLSHWEQIDNIYIECARITKETGIKHHVDHIIPLQGKEVRGLHVPWNLQILTAKENESKGNKY